MTAAAALAVGVLTACPAEETVPAAPAATVPRSEQPVDSTKPGEIAEGTERAFGFPIPRGMTIKARFPDAIYARGRVALEPLANYVRDRVEAKRVDTGPVKTVFVQASLKADPSQQVRVEVSSKGGMAQLLVRDHTRRPAEKGLSAEERWRRSGVTPDGRVREDMAE